MNLRKYLYVEVDKAQYFIKTFLKNLPDFVFIDLFENRKNGNYRKIEKYKTAKTEKTELQTLLNQEALANNPIRFLNMPIICLN